MTVARAYGLALASGALLTLAYPEPDLAPVAWIALAPLLVAIGGGAREPVSARRAFGLGYAFGVGFFSTLLFWITLVGYVAWILLVVLQAAFVGLFGAAWWVAARRPSAWARVALAATGWVAIEFIRSRFPLGGFTWGQLAQSQHNVPWLLKSAAIGGGWAISLLIVAANALLAEGWRALKAKHAGRAPVFVVTAVVVLGSPALLPAPEVGGEPVRIAIVQGNVPRRIPRGLEREIAIIESHTALTEGLAGSEVDLVVWPESSFGLDPEVFPEAGDALVRAATGAGAPMVIGANEDVDEDHYLVVALLVSETGQVVDRYQKTHLVPFGEYVPGRRWLDWIPLIDQVPRDAVSGSEHTVFEVAGGTVAPVISYEGDFGSLARRPIANGGRLLVVATNTSTWGESWASAQHVAFSQVRAAENGVWVVHAALSGISAFIAPDGTVVSRTPLWTATTLVDEVSFADGITFYARVGDWLPWTSLGASLIGLALAWARRRDATVME